MPLDRPLDARLFGSIPLTFEGAFRRTGRGLRSVFGAADEAYVQNWG